MFAEQRTREGSVWSVELCERVLVVDDDELVRDLLEHTLSPQFDVDVVLSGEQALEKLATRQYAVLLSDQRMPHMTGIELSQQAIEVQKHIVPILLSAYTEPDDMIAAINDGQIYRFIRKPWEPQDLLHTIQTAIDRHKLGVRNAQLMTELDRRLRAMELLLSTVGGDHNQQHPVAALLDELHETIAYDFLALVTLDTDAVDRALEVSLRATISLGAAEAEALRDQALELFHHYRPGEGTSVVRTISRALRIDPEQTPRRLGAHVHVTLGGAGARGTDVTGVLLLQRLSEHPFEEDSARFLDVLANGSHAVLQRLQERRHSEWGRVDEVLAQLPAGTLLVRADGGILLANSMARRLISGHVKNLWTHLQLDPALNASRGLPQEVLLSGDLLLQVRCTLSRAAPEVYLVTLEDLRDREVRHRRRREFMAVFSHEIRTPLSAISAAIDLLQAESAERLPPEERHYLEQAGLSRDTLIAMINDVLDFERYEDGIFQHRLNACDAKRVLEDVAAQHQAAAVQRGLELFADASPKMCTIISDKQRLKQVVANLVSNALKFAHKETRVQLSCQQTAALGGWTIVSVRNQGHALSVHDKRLIFDRFKQTEAEKRMGRGSGLGLAIARNIVERLGGAILVESGNAGTCFLVVLPNAGPKDDAGVSHESPRYGAEPVWVDGSAPEGRLRAAVVATLLRREGLWVHWSGSAAEEAAGQEVFGEGLTIGCARTPMSLGQRTPDLPLDPISDSEVLRMVQALSALSTSCDADRVLVHALTSLAPAIARVLGCADPMKSDKVRGTPEASVVASMVAGNENQNVSAGLLPSLLRVHDYVRSGGTVSAQLVEMHRLVQEAGWGELHDMQVLVGAMARGQAFRLAYGAERLREFLEAWAAAVKEAQVETLVIGSGILVVGLPETLEVAQEQLKAVFQGLLRLQADQRDLAREAIAVGQQWVPMVEARLQRLGPRWRVSEVLDLITEASALPGQGSTVHNV